MAKGRRQPWRRWSGLDAHRPKPWREATKCIFCGIEETQTTEGRLTHEHVFSNWTRRFVPRTMRGYRSLRAIRQPDRTSFAMVRRRSGDLRDLQVRCVCGACNNGWMREFVDDCARPIMIPLITGSHVRIDPSQLRVIATWAAMKAMVAEFDEAFNSYHTPYAAEVSASLFATAATRMEHLHCSLYSIQ